MHPMHDITLSTIGSGSRGIVHLLVMRRKVFSWIVDYLPDKSLSD